MKKILFIIIDGLGDQPIKALGDKTPLEVAKTPNLDFLAKEGKTGLIYPISKKIAPESDTAITALLGYDPYKYFTGRGPIEAFGFGLKFKKGNLALRTNFATTSGKKIIDRRAGRTLTSQEAKELASSVNKKVKLSFPFIFQPTLQHRGVLLIYGNLSGAISNTDPGYEKVGNLGVVPQRPSFNLKESKPQDKKKISQLSANLINEFTRQSHKILENHPLNKERTKKNLLPANIILARDAGIDLPKFPPKKEKWAAVCSMPLEKGLALLSKMDLLTFRYPEMKNQDVYSHLYYGLREEMKYGEGYLKEKLSQYDAFYLHFKEIDIPGHDGRPKDKIKMLEILDKDFFSFLRKLKNVLVVVTGDHSTPCKIKLHTSDPVPLLIYDGKNKDGVLRFGESYCRGGSLGHIMGKDLMKKVLSLSRS